MPVKRLNKVTVFALLILTFLIAYMGKGYLTGKEAEWKWQVLLL